MTRSTALVVLGAFVAASPFLGLGSSVLAWLLPALGILVAAIAFTLRPKRVREPEAAAPLNHDAPLA